MTDATDVAARTHVAKRKIFLRRVKNVQLHYALKKYWPLAQSDWAALGIFAERRFLPLWVYESLFTRNSWYLNVILCSNPDTPLALLRRMANLETDGPLTLEKINEQTFDTDPSSIKNIALAAIRRRL